jgi:hypothetical protein
LVHPYSNRFNHEQLISTRILTQKQQKSLDMVKTQRSSSPRDKINPEGLFIYESLRQPEHADLPKVKNEVLTAAVSDFRAREG